MPGEDLRLGASGERKASKEDWEEDERGESLEMQLWGRISEARRRDIPGGRVSCAKYTEKSNSKTETPAWVDNQEIIVKVLVAQLCLTF